MLITTNTPYVFHTDRPGTDSNQLPAAAIDCTAWRRGSGRDTYVPILVVMLIVIVMIGLHQKRLDRSGVEVGKHGVGSIGRAGR